MAVERSLENINAGCNKYALPIILFLIVLSGICYLSKNRGDYNLLPPPPTNTPFQPLPPTEIPLICATINKGGNMTNALIWLASQLQRDINDSDEMIFCPVKDPCRNITLRQARNMDLVHPGDKVCVGGQPKNPALKYRREVLAAHHQPSKPIKSRIRY